jgi:hypothetical protein
MSVPKNDESPVTFSFQQYPDIVRDSSQMGSSCWAELSEGSTKVLLVTDGLEKLQLREYLLSDSRIHVTDTVLRLSDACRALRSANYDVVLIALNAHRSDLFAPAPSARCGGFKPGRHSRTQAVVRLESDGLPLP